MMYFSERRNKTYYLHQYSNPNGTGSIWVFTKNPLDTCDLPKGYYVTENTKGMPIIKKIRVEGINYNPLMEYK